jgi:hypothetical protein
VELHLIVGTAVEEEKALLEPAQIAGPVSTYPV